LTGHTRIATDCAKGTKAAMREEGIPRYRTKRQGRYAYAVVTLRDVVTGARRDVRLGEPGTAASRTAYARAIARWEAAKRTIPPELLVRRNRPGRELTVTSLCAAFWRHTQATATRKHRNAVKLASRVFRRLYGEDLAAAIGPLKLAEARDVMIAGDPQAPGRPRPPWSRRTTNDRIAILLGMYRWGAARELIPAHVYHTLRTLEPLRAGRSPAAEPGTVVPVDQARIDAAKTHLGPRVADMVDVQLTTGMRPGELCAMRPCDIDTTGRVWVYRPPSHKTAHLGRARVILIGPRAQAIIRRHLRADTTAPVFSPRQTVEDYRREHPGQRTPRQIADRPRSPRDRYTPDSYRRAIVRACARAGIPAWHPHQLRHTYATAVRREYGLEAAQILLGHGSAQVTDAVYAERDLARAKRIAARIG